MKPEARMAQFIGCGTTSRQYKQLKRKQLRAVEKAFEEYQHGHMGSPAIILPISAIYDALNVLRNRQSIKKWGR